MLTSITTEYELGETLGRGAYARVVVGTHKATSERVALKVLALPSTATSRRRRSVQLQNKWELEALRAVGDHPHVAGLRAFRDKVAVPNEDGSATPCTVTVLEMCPHFELYDYLHVSGRFRDQRLTRTYFLQLLDGLEAVHKAGYMHRDLKPNNIMFDQDFRLKLVDFGFAQRFLDERGRGRVLDRKYGSAGYMAPEMYTGAYGRRADLFALGVLLYVIHSGRQPFREAVDGDDGWELAKNGQWSFFFLSAFVSFPRPLKSLIKALLRQDPARRPGFGEIRQFAWCRGKTLSKRELGRVMADKCLAVMQHKENKKQQEAQEGQGGTAEEESAASAPRREGEE